MNVREAKGGFTLTELLVSTAIFALLMTSIGALFVASLHAMRAGYQSQEAFELSRGTFNVLERDLTTMFTARDAGQYYQFYGNEYGMMMVGMLQLRDENGREYNRVGRVTYVIYPVVIRAPQPDLGFYVTQPFALDYNKKVGVENYDPLQPAIDFHRTRGMRFSSPVEDGPETEIAIAALVRYVEPGVSDLDTYPFNWETLISDTEGNPEFPQVSSSESIRSQLNDSLEAGTLSGSPSDDLNFLGRITDSRDRMLAAKKRDLWLKMLSCQKYWIPKLVSGAPILPNPWGRLDNTGTVTERCWLKNGSTLEVVNPRDFIAVDNLGVFTNNYFTTFPMMASFPQSTPNYKPFFGYGRVAADIKPDLIPFWNASYLAYIGDCTYLPGGFDFDQNGEIAQIGERMIFAAPNDPGILLIDPLAYERDGRDNNANVLIDEANEDFLDPVRVLFENDDLDNDFDGTVDEAGEYIDLRHAAEAIDPILSDDDNFDNNSDGDIDEPNEAPLDRFTSYASPLQPRIPEVVMVRLPMVYAPAHHGAPTFERTMEQLIEVPTAYTRSKLAGAQP